MSLGNGKSPLAYIFQRRETASLDIMKKRTCSMYGASNLRCNSQFTKASQIEEKYWAHRRGSDVSTRPISIIGSPGTAPDTHSEGVSSIAGSLLLSSIQESTQEQGHPRAPTPGISHPTIHVVTYNEDEAREEEAEARVHSEPPSLPLISKLISGQWIPQLLLSLRPCFNRCKNVSISATNTWSSLVKE